MPRGGYRENSGRKGKWKSGKTKMIRVPEAIADELLDIAHELDQRNFSEPFSNHNQNTIDLSNVRLISVNGQMGVALSELIKKGYSLKPSQLNNLLF